MPTTMQVVGLRSETAIINANSEKILYKVPLAELRTSLFTIEFEKPGDSNAVSSQILQMCKVMENGQESVDHVKLSKFSNGLNFKVKTPKVSTEAHLVIENADNFDIIARYVRIQV